MKNKKLILITLLIAGISAFAGTTSAVSNGEFLKEATAKKKTGKNILGVNASSLLSRSNSGLPGLSGITGGGVFINAGLFFPSSSYLGIGGFSMGYDVEWGHYFKLVKVSQFSIGIRATWISASYTKFDNFITLNAVSASLLRPGIQGMYAIKDHIAVNLFYQLGFDYTRITESGGNSFIGLTHEIGAGIQWRILNLGFGYRFGSLKNTESGDPASYSINNFRVYLGIKL